MRSIVRRIWKRVQPRSWPLLYPRWPRVVPRRSLWVGPHDPLAHFFRWPFEYRAYLSLLCDLGRDSRVLELGCNHGRTMLGLLDYLRPPGAYEGFDILTEQVRFAQRTITPRFPNFRFTCLDVRSRHYNPAGRLDATTLRFPYDDDGFEVAYAASLFTHLTPPATENYLRETRRVLRTGGRCLFSFFVLDFYGGRGTALDPWYDCVHPLPGFEGVAVRNPDVPEALIAYRGKVIEALAARSGLRVARIVPGYWSQTQRWTVNEQDLVLMEKE